VSGPEKFRFNERNQFEAQHGFNSRNGNPLTYILEEGMDDEQIFYCKNCDAEFDPYAEDVKIVHQSHGGLITIEDSSHRAHSLRLTTWKKIQRIRELEDSARPVNPFNLYQAQDIEIEQDESEVETDEIQGEPENGRN